jgi:DedD protein
MNPILVIDNDPETTRRIEEVLRSEGYLVFISPTESLAITTARETDPSLIFISLIMPRGLEISKNIHSIGEFSKTPIIALTSQEKGPKTRYGAEYGIIDTLDKSFSPEELILKAETVLSIRGITETAHAGITNIPEYETIESKTFDIPSEKSEERPSVFGEIENSAPAYEEVEGLIERSFEPKKGNPAEKNRKIVLVKKRSNLPLIIGVGTVLIISAAGFLLWQGGGIDFKTIFKDIKQKLPVKATTQVPKKEPVPEPQPPVKPPVPETPTVETSKVIIGTLPKDPLKEPPLKDAPLKESLKEKPVKERSFYSAQVGAFKNIENAEAITERLKKNGYDAFIHSITRGNEKVHRVLVGKFEEKKEAEKLASTLKTKENISALVFSFDSLKNP